MAKTHGDRLGAIENKLAELEHSLELNRTTSDIHTEYTKTAIKEMQATDVRRAEADAKLNQRCTALEKNSDRGWQLWLAAIGFGFISLLVTAALQLKK